MHQVLSDACRPAVIGPEPSTDINAVQTLKRSLSIDQFTITSHFPPFPWKSELDHPHFPFRGTRKADTFHSINCFPRYATVAGSVAHSLIDCFVPLTHLFSSLCWELEIPAHNVRQTQSETDSKKVPTAADDVDYEAARGFGPSISTPRAANSLADQTVLYQGQRDSLSPLD